MNHSQPYKCENEEIFQSRLATLKEYIQEANIDGVLDHYCPTSPVLYHVTKNAVYTVDPILSHDIEHFQRVCQDLLRLITEENGGQIPIIHHVYA